MIQTRRRGARSRLVPMSDMNVTPMIDVMLVLLVIFMVTAPLLTVGVKVNLPTANAPNIDGNDVPVVVHVNAEGRVFIGEVEVVLDTLPAKLRAITRENFSDSKIFVRGDRSLSYGKIMEVMGCIGGAGFRKIVLITELPKQHEQNAFK